MSFETLKSYHHPVVRQDDFLFIEIKKASSVSQKGYVMETEDIPRELPVTLKDYLASAREALNVFQWTWGILPVASKKRFKPLFIALVIVTAATLALPRFVGMLVDGASQRRSDAILLGFAGIALCLIVSKVADYVFAVSREWVLGLNWGAVDHHITTKFFEKSVSQHINEAQHLTISNIDKGKWKLLDLQGLILFEGIPTIVSLLFCYVFLFCLVPVVGVIMTVGIIAYLTFTLYLNQKVMTICTPLDAEFRRLNRYRYGRCEKAERVKISTRVEEEVAHTDAWFDRVILQDRRFWLWFIRQNVKRGSITSICLMVSLGYGVWLVATGQAQASLLLPLFFWTTQFKENLWRIGHLEHQINWNAPAVRSMINAISIEPDVVSGSITVDPQQPLTIEFDDVHLRYQAEDGSITDNPAVLGGINFTIGPGEKVALLSKSGAGKTSVMRLLLRCMNTSAGCIRIQGHDIRELDLNSWWRTVGYISQDAKILDGSIRDNLLYALSAAERAAMSDEQVWQLMERLQINFGARLTNGLDTLVGHNGVKLSGGQAQRLMIGAAVAKKPRFMIIDEATSNLDSITERDVQRGLALALPAEVGALIVAHRLSTVEHICTRFIVLRSLEEIVAGESQIEAQANNFVDLYHASSTFRQLADVQGLRITADDTRVSAHLSS